MRTTNLTRRLVAAAGLALCLAAGAHAQTWSSAAPGSWNDPANWSPMTVPNGVGAQAYIASTAAGGPLAMTGGTISFSTPITLGHLSADMGFAGQNLYLTPSVLTLDNGGGADVTMYADGSYGVWITGQIVLMGDLVAEWRASNGEISASISGDHAVIQDAVGGIPRLRLYGANTYTGGTFVRNGWVGFKNAGNLGGQGATVVVESGGTLVMEQLGKPTISGLNLSVETGGRIIVRECDWANDITMVGDTNFAPWFDNYEVTLSGRITGDATFIRYSAQSRNGDDASESILTLTNTANDYTGGTIIRAGVLRFADDAVLGAPGTPITFHLVGFSEGPPAIATTASTIIARDIVMTTNGWLRADPGTIATYDGVISGSRSLSIGFLGWTGGVNLAGANTYNQGTNVRAGTLFVTNTSGSATGTGAVTIEPGAALAGDGAISGAVTVGDTALVAPGLSTGTLNVGAITFAPTAMLDIELDGVDPGQFDRIEVAGTAALDGHLAVSYIDGYFPNVNDEFEIISAASVTGFFATTDLPDGFEIDYFADRVVLRAANVTPPCPADLNSSGEVDGTDLGLLLGAWGTNNPAADLNDSGNVDGTDLGLLLGAWGACP